MKVLSGEELASYIKERQAKQIRNLKQSWKVFPKLAIVQTTESQVISSYVTMKKRYAEDIGVELVSYMTGEDKALELIQELNNDFSVHGIIVQLPLRDQSRTDQLVNLVAPAKDVDGLGSGATLDPATPMAINWLLAGYNVELARKKIVIIGQGRLVGRPLAAMWTSSGYDIKVLDSPTDNLKSILLEADIIVSAVGQPGLITSEMLRPETVVVDAATSSENGKIVGDLAEDVRERHDLVLTPVRGGVGPLTICALFDNVIRAARHQAEVKTI
jgi:methylenetetrahydrofolate dehydrogenase (NADP+) / methenyltetrahydrofolate cyclohydrolase